MLYDNVRFWREPEDILHSVYTGPRKMRNDMPFNADFRDINDQNLNVT